MLKKVLFPVIMTEHTEQIINCLGGLAKNGVEHVTLLHVVNVSETMNGNVDKKHDETLLKRWQQQLIESGIKTDYEIITGIPWIEIVDIAERKNYSFIMIGSHGSSFLDRMLLGSVTENVVHHSNKPVFIYKLLKDNPAVSGPVCVDIFNRIIFATDFSESSLRCIPYIEKMHNKHSQILDILHIQDLRNLAHVSEEKIQEFNRIDTERMMEMKKHFETVGFKKVNFILQTGYSVSEILEYEAKSKATIIVLGRKGKSNVKEMLLGGVAETVIHRSQIPVFIVEHGM